MRDYKRLDIWKRSYKFALDIYKVTSLFPKHEIYSLTNQIRRSSMSMPANIAEGCGRSTSADFARFLEISLSSGFETEHHLIFSYDLGYLSGKDYNLLLKEIDELKKMISSYMLSVRENN
jgi:four helix bundle protein